VQENTFSCYRTALQSASMLAKPTRRPRVQFAPRAALLGVEWGWVVGLSFSSPPGLVPGRDPIYTLPGVPRLMGSCTPAPRTALHRTAQSLPRLVVPCTATYAGGTRHARSSHRSSDTSASPRGGDRHPGRASAVLLVVSRRGTCRDTRPCGRRPRGGGRNNQAPHPRLTQLQQSTTARIEPCKKLAMRARHALRVKVLKH